MFIQHNGQVVAAMLSSKLAPNLRSGARRIMCHGWSFPSDALDLRSAARDRPERFSWIRNGSRERNRAIPSDTPHLWSAVRDRANRCRIKRKMRRGAWVNVSRGLVEEIIHDMLKGLGAPG